MESNYKIIDNNGSKVELDVFLQDLNLNECKRIEVIDENGRTYMNWNKSNFVKLLLQDNNRTLKVFISKQ